MWDLLKLKRLFQVTFFVIWSFLLIYLICLSIFTFILFTICLSIFLFWFTLTLIGWLITWIPILKFVFIPWYHRQCRLWTIKEQQRRLSVAFFQPYSNNRNDRDRVLWTAVESILKKYKNDIQIIIYTKNIGAKPEEILQHVKQRWNINIEVYQHSITFIYLRSPFLLETKYSLIQHIASSIVGFEALLRFIPDIYIDSTGYTFIYPWFYYFAGIPILSYVHSPLINDDLLKPTSDQYITDSSLLSHIELIYYELFTYFHGWCRRCSNIICYSSSWTKKQIESRWNTRSMHLVYPPCNVREFVGLPLIKKDEIVISLGSFQSEQNHEVQIRAFYELLQRKSEYQQKLKLKLIGHMRYDHDEKYIEQLQTLINDLNINDKVEFQFNVTFEELKNELSQAKIGLHTTQNEHFGIDIVEMMAAGTIVLAHKSGGPKMDIIIEGQTGFLASDIDSYATKLQQIFEMNDDDQHQLQEQARDSIQRFDKLNFELVFMELFDQILLIK